jgi:hypothetical protein
MAIHHAWSQHAFVVIARVRHSAPQCTSGGKFTKRKLKAGVAGCRQCHSRSSTHQIGMDANTTGMATPSARREWGRTHPHRQALISTWRRNTHTVHKRGQERSIPASMITRPGQHQHTHTLRSWARGWPLKNTARDRTCRVQAIHSGQKATVHRAGAPVSSLPAKVNGRQARTVKGAYAAARNANPRCLAGNVGGAQEGTSDGATEEISCQVCLSTHTRASAFPHSLELPVERSQQRVVHSRVQSVQAAPGVDGEG